VFASADDIENRARIIMHRESNWVRCKWNRKELDGALVNFNLERGQARVLGDGTFRVAENPEGFLRISVLTFGVGKLPEVLQQIELALDQSEADQIERKSPAANFRVRSGVTP